MVRVKTSSNPEPIAGHLRDFERLRQLAAAARERLAADGGPAAAGAP